jgi:hypothetical protein
MVLLISHLIQCIFVNSDMNTDTSKGNKDSKGSKKDIDVYSIGGSVMDVGDTSRDIRDTGDVARASIAKGRGAQESRTAAEIAKGQIESDESVIQGTAATTTTTTTATPNSAEDDKVSKDKVVSSGTSLNEDKSIDKADIYSTEETGTRHLDRAQERPVEKVEDKEKGSWRIKEEGEET